MRQNPLTLYGMIIAQGQALMLIGVSGLNLLVRSENTIADIPIIKIRPNKAQPRKVFSEDELSALSRSIAENGILQPLTVRKVSSTEYELVAGERRLRAAVMAGLRKVPCIVVKCSDRESAVYALLENLQRADLGIFEEARGIAKLIRRYGLTQEQAAIKLGKKQSTIANKLRLLRLGFEEQEWILTANLSERHARTLLRINDENLRREVLSRIIADDLSVGEAEALVTEVLTKKNEPAAEKKQEHKIAIKDVRIFVNTINKAVDTMRLSGINAISRRSETDEYIEYTVKIPKAARREKIS